jgi:hypothetical protein
MPRHPNQYVAAGQVAERGRATPCDAGQVSGLRAGVPQAAPLVGAIDMRGEGAGGAALRAEQDAPRRERVRDAF